jgi:hypothetical protein
MQQRVTRELLGYWSALRGIRAMPDRADLDPGAIRTCLSDAFVLAFDPERGHPFRIAGTAVCAMFGRELVRTPFDRLWFPDDRDSLAGLVRDLADNAQALVAGVTAHNGDGEAAELELILLPLTCADGAGRILGALPAVSAPYWLGTRPLQALHLGALRHANADNTVVSVQGRSSRLPAMAHPAE